MEIVFFGGWPHTAGMIGAGLNALGILAGALAGGTWSQPLSLRVQQWFRLVLGVGAIGAGLQLTWLSVNGTLAGCARQVTLGALALMLGHAGGRLAGLQRWSNRAGRQAARSLTVVPGRPPATPGAALTAVTALFCASPLGLVGALVDGWSGYFYLLALKAVMDGLAMTSFVKTFRWPTALAAVPVLTFFGGISLASHQWAAPWLERHHGTDAVNLIAGWMACATGVVILELRRVELANFLPALALAPLLAWLLG